MKLDLDTADRMARLVFGAGLIGASLLGEAGVGGWIGLVPLATGLFKVCPAWVPFRIEAGEHAH